MFSATSHKLKVLILFFAFLDLKAVSIKLIKGEYVELEIVTAKYSEATCTKNGSPYVLKYNEIDMAWLKENQSKEYDLLVEGRNKAVTQSNAKICQHLADVLIDPKYGPNKRPATKPSSAKPELGNKEVTGDSPYEKILNFLNSEHSNTAVYRSMLVELSNTRKVVDKLTGKETETQVGLIQNIISDPEIIVEHTTTKEFLMRIEKLKRILMIASQDVEDAIKRKDSVGEVYRKAQKENVRKELVELHIYLSSLGIKPFSK